MTPAFTKWVGMFTNLVTFNTVTNCAFGGATMIDEINSDARIATMPSTADYVLVNGATNDWSKNKVLGNLTTLANNQTYTGALDSMITKMKAKYPTATIVFITPLFAYSNGSALNTNSKSTLDFANAMKSVCSLRSVPCIDVYTESGITVSNYTTYLRRESNGVVYYVHPTLDGDVKILESVYNYFN